jgi:hypothetical protein
LDQALSTGGRFQDQSKLLTSGEKRERSLLRGLEMQMQHRGGRLMQLKDPPNPAMIDGDFVTGLDNPCECPSGEGVRKSEPNDLGLHMERYV